MTKEDAINLFNNEIDMQLFVIAVQNYLKELVEHHPKFKDLPNKEVSYQKTESYVQQAFFLHQVILNKIREFYKVKYNIQILTNKNNEIIKVF